MIRTQIYLTKRQRDKLAAICKVLGKNQSEVIREAIDRFLEETRNEKVLEEAAGIWKDRTDLPDFRRIRGDWDRN